MPNPSRRNSFFKTFTCEMVLKNEFLREGFFLWTRVHYFQFAIDSNASLSKAFREFGNHRDDCLRRSFRTSSRCHFMPASAKFCRENSNVNVVGLRSERKAFFSVGHFLYEKDEIRFYRPNIIVHELMPKSFLIHPEAFKRFLGQYGSHSPAVTHGNKIGKSFTVELGVRNRRALIEISDERNVFRSARKQSTAPLERGYHRVHVAVTAGIVEDSEE
jgi:hypothetical protein